MYEKLKFTDEDGETTEFYVIEQTKVNGTDYLLVVDNVEDEEADAIILKDMSQPEDREAAYVAVSRTDELESISKIFNELLEDMDIE